MAKPTRLPLRGAAVVELLKRKWERELDYKLKKELDECVGDLPLIETAATSGIPPVRDAGYKH